MLLRSLLLALPLAAALDIRGQVALDTAAATLPPSSKVALSNPSRSVFVNQDGSFVFDDVEDGEHILETYVKGYIYQPLLLTITNSTPHLQPFYSALLPLSPSSFPSLPTSPILLRPLSKEDYFAPPPSANVLGLLKSPMVLMMLFSGLMLYAMPKITAMMEMDEDTMKDVAETRKKMQGMQNGDWAGALSSLLAGQTEPEASASVTTGSPARAPAPAGAGANGGGAGARRRKGR